MTTLAFSSLRDIATIYENGAWHFKDGKQRDNIGDFTMGVALVGDRRWYVLMARMGSPPPAGSMWFSPYDDDPYSGWTQGLPEGSKPEPPVKSLPVPSGAGNVDTHCWVQNRLTGVFTWVHAVSDEGTKRYHLERATSSTINAQPEAYTRWTTDLTTPNTQECSLVIDPWAGEGVLFYVRKTTEPRDPYGIRFRSRVYRRTWSLRDFDTDPVLGEEQLVFDPPAQGDAGEWGTAYTVLQPGICILPDRSYLMAAIGKRPIVRHDGDPAVGLMNATAAVGAWRSVDRGMTWEPLPGPHPLFSRDYLELPNGVANAVNSPHFWYDPWARKLYFACQRSKVGEVNKLGSRLVLAEQGA